MGILLIWYDPQPQRPLHPPKASEVKSDLGFEISVLNYLLIHVHIANMVWALLAASKANSASEATYSLQTPSRIKSDLSDLHSMCDQSTVAVYS